MESIDVSSEEYCELRCAIEDMFYGVGATECNWLAPLMLDIYFGKDNVYISVDEKSGYIALFDMPLGRNEKDIPWQGRSHTDIVNDIKVAYMEICLGGKT